MRNVLVAYISYARFRKLPLIRGLLGESFTPSQLPSEHVFADEPAAAAVAAQIEDIGFHGNDDGVVLAAEEPRELRLEHAVLLAARDPSWTGAERDNFPLWRVRAASLRRCIAITVHSSRAAIGQSLGFLVDRETEHVFFRHYWRIGDFVDENVAAEWSVGDISLELR